MAVDATTAPCPVCGAPVGEGEGVTVYYDQEPVRLRCDQCADRFLADPELYLAPHPLGCCAERRDDSASEWRCD